MSTCDDGGAMQLPADFPHSRHEQYLMVMPVELLSRAEAATKRLLIVRFRYHLRSLLLPRVQEAMGRGLTLEEAARKFVAEFEGPLPRCFTADPGGASPPTRLISR